MRTSPRFLAWVGLGALLLAGCPPKTSFVRVNADPSPELNKDRNGNAASVEMRVYQLKGKDRFERATYDALWNQERETLAEDYIKREQKTVLPATPQTVEVQRDPQATFLGVAAAFRDSPGDEWKKVVALQPKSPMQVITVKLGEKSVDLQTGGKAEKKKKKKGRRRMIQNFLF